MNNLTIIFLVIILYIFYVFLAVKVAEIINTKLNIYGDLSIMEFIVVALVSVFFAIFYLSSLYYILGPHNFSQWFNFIYIIKI